LSRFVLFQYSDAILSFFVVFPFVAVFVRSALGIDGDLDKYRPPPLPLASALQQLREEAYYGRAPPAPAAPAAAGNNDGAIELLEISRQQTRQFESIAETFAHQANYNADNNVWRGGMDVWRRNTDARLGENVEWRSNTDARLETYGADIDTLMRVQGLRVDGGGDNGIDAPQQEGDDDGGGGGGDEIFAGEDDPHDAPLQEGDDDGGGDDIFAGEDDQHDAPLHEGDDVAGGGGNDPFAGEDFGALLSEHSTGDGGEWHTVKKFDDADLTHDPSSQLPVANGTLRLQRHRANASLSRIVMDGHDPMVFSGGVPVKQSGEFCFFMVPPNQFVGVRIHGFELDKVEIELREFWGSCTISKPPSGMHRDHQHNDDNFGGDGGSDVVEGGDRDDAPCVENAHETSEEPAGTHHHDDDDSLSGGGDSPKADDSSFGSDSSVEKEEAMPAEANNSVEETKRTKLQRATITSATNDAVEDDSALAIPAFVAATAPTLSPAVAPPMEVLVAQRKEKERNIIKDSVLTQFADVSDEDSSDKEEEEEEHAMGDSPKADFSSVRFAKENTYTMLDAARLSVGSDDTYDDHVSVFGWARRQNTERNGAAVEPAEPRGTDEDEAVVAAGDGGGKENYSNGEALGDGGATKESSTTDKKSVSAPTAPEGEGETVQSRGGVLGEPAVAAGVSSNNPPNVGGAGPLSSLHDAANSFSALLGDFTGNAFSSWRGRG